MEADAPRSLPDDVLADILARLPPRGLAVSRSVWAEWRAVADARCELRADLLPTALGGIFVRTNEAETPEFFVRPSLTPHKIAADLEYYQDMDEHCKYTPDVEDSCNGLLLLEDHVVNPATRQWVRLPPYPAALFDHDQGYHYRYLVFDPMVSPHYEVVAMRGPPRYMDEMLKRQGRLEWPPSESMMRFYSSTTGRWEQRPFVRKGQEIAVPNLSPGVSSNGPYHGVYWHGALYLHWSYFCMRINLSNDTYQVINLPADGIKATKYYRPHLGKSKNGVHLVVVDDERRLQVWFLHEFGDSTDWVLKHATDLQDIKFPKLTDRPWILQDRNYNKANRRTLELEKELDWDSDEDNAVDVEKWDEKCPFFHYIEALGFHPYREIILMLLSRARVVSYYFNSSKIQDLGGLRFKHRSNHRCCFHIYTLLDWRVVRKQLI